METVTVKDVEATILRCRYCGSLTVEMGGMAQCPKGCPGYFAVLGGCRIPAEGVEHALKTVDRT
jgi:phage FluMu protein Com